MAISSRRYTDYDDPPFESFGSHMPLDTEIHWDWRNPLNAILGLLLLRIALAVMALI